MDLYEVVTVSCLEDVNKIRFFNNLKAAEEYIKYHEKRYPDDKIHLVTHDHGIEIKSKFNEEDEK